MKEWYKWQSYWRRIDGDRDGTGDLIYNTLTKIIMDGDTSDWAMQSFMDCAWLLTFRLRWPSELNTGHEAPNRYAWALMRLWRDILRLFGKKYRLYGPQTRMSRDPFIALGACYEFLLGSNDELLTRHFVAAKIPWYLYRPDTWRWRRRLLKDNRKLYVKRLSYLRALAVVRKFERTDKLWKG